jgi:pyruvate formate lyase activating enzyme
MTLFLPIFPARRYQNLPVEFEKIRDWIRRSLGKFNPWHVTRFVPHLTLSPVPSTPVRVLETARQVGLKEGLEYVYLENVYRHPAENTYCPGCGSLLIQRCEFSVLGNDPTHGRCIRCRFLIWGPLDA